MIYTSKRCRDDIRKALMDYNTIVSTARNKISHVREDYGEEAADRESERQEKIIMNARNQAESVIRQSHKDAVSGLAIWGQLDGANLTDDAKLLTAGLVDPAEFDRLKEKYHDNATMLTALKKYADQENAKELEQAHKNGEFFVSEKYNVHDISTADDRIVNWNRLQKSAVDRLDMIDGSGQYRDSWNQAFAKAFNAESGIDEFGEGIDL